MPLKPPVNLESLLLPIHIERNEKGQARKYGRPFQTAGLADMDAEQ